MYNPQRREKGVFEYDPERLLGAEVPANPTPLY
jgi:hypothetical protein